jgi:tRNA dimethylallyltransferase
MAGPPELLVVLGPTATGKSDLAVRLARRLGGRVINADSVQVYRGLDAGSCKPPPEARESVPHYLIDVADPARPFSAGDFARMAEQAIAECRAAGAVPIVAGGTGLYLRALLHGLAPMPPRDDAVREALYTRARESSPATLHAELALVDPETAGRLGPNDLQRVVRALEVATLTGRPLSHHIRTEAFDPGRMVSLKIGLALDRGILNDRIDRRVDAIFEAGLVEEVRGLLRGGVPPGANAFKALGYREVIARLQEGGDPGQARELVKRNTRRYARRQMVWFRKEPGVIWLDVGEGLDAAEKRAAVLWGEAGGSHDGQ